MPEASAAAALGHEHLGEARPLATVADDEIGGALEQLWGEAAVNTWNARRAAVLSWLGWCAERGYDGPKVPAWVKRLPPPDSETPARSKMAVDRLIARRDVHLPPRSPAARTRRRAPLTLLSPVCPPAVPAPTPPGA